MEPTKAALAPRPFTAEEDALLHQWSASGWSRQAMAKRLNRNKNSVGGRLFRLGLPTIHGRHPWTPNSHPGSAGHLTAAKPASGGGK